MVYYKVLFYLSMHLHLLGFIEEKQTMNETFIIKSTNKNILFLQFCIPKNFTQVKLTSFYLKLSNLTCVIYDA